MPDLQEKLNQILSNPEALKQVQSLGEQLGLTQAPQPPKQTPQPTQPPSTAKGDLMQAVSKFAPLLNSVKKEDDTTRLLRALRPFLSEERRQKLDKAEKMLKLLRLMPLLKDLNLFL
jgi:hypothetical protein